MTCRHRKQRSASTVTTTCSIEPPPTKQEENFSDPHPPMGSEKNVLSYRRVPSAHHMPDMAHEGQEHDGLLSHCLHCCPREACLQSADHQRTPRGSPESVLALLV